MSEKASSLERGVPAGQVKDKPTEDHLEHYEHKTGFSYGFAAIAEVSAVTRILRVRYDRSRGTRPLC